MTKPKRHPKFDRLAFSPKLVSDMARFLRTTNEQNQGRANHLSVVCNYAIESGRLFRRMGSSVKNHPWMLRRENWICLVLGLITLAVFSPCLTHEFLAYDDQQYVTENLRVQAGLTWPGVVWAFKSYYASNWHPLTWLSHMLDCQFYGLKPAGHHLTSVVLHTANTVLLFLLLNRMTASLWRSAMVAALFAWHPLHVESVAWVAERKDVLSAFFFMLTLWAYVSYADSLKSEVQSLKSEVRDRAPSVPTGTRSTASLKFSEGTEIRRPNPVAGGVVSNGRRSTLHAPRNFYALSLLFFALGLMSKPMLVTLPFVLLLLDYWPLKRNVEFPAVAGRVAELGAPKASKGSTIWPRLLAEKIPFFVLSAICCVLTVAAQRQAYSVVSVAALPISRRIFHALISYVHYLCAMVVPSHLAVAYPYSSATNAEGVGAALLLVAISLLALRLAARRPYLAVGWLWYLGMLVPVIGLVQVGEQAWADRYTYLPVIGLFLALVWGAGEFAGEKLAWETRKKGAGRAVVWGLTAALGAALLVASSFQLRHWRNTRTLFEHAAAVTHNNARAITMLGSVLAEEGKLEEAKALYAQALGYNPREPEAHFSLGRALERQGKLDEAITEYTQALWYRPLREQAQIFIGMVLAKQKRYDEAAARYRAALEVNPESAAAHNNLARLLHTQGRLDEAIVHYFAALKSDPGLAQAHNNLGVLLLQKGRPAEGAVQLREALRLKPGDAESQLNLAQALVQQEQWREAADLFAKTVTAATANPNVHYQFATALARLGQTRAAMSQYASALILQQDFPAALDGLAWILATDADAQVRNGEQAYAMAERACELTGRKDPEKLKTLAAACAESGRFSQALFDAQAGLDLASKNGQKEVAGECRLMLGEFRARKPWREPR